MFISHVNIVPKIAECDCCLSRSVALPEMA